MIKWYFRVVFADGTFALETFEAKDKFAAYAKIQNKHKKFKTLLKLTKAEYDEWESKSTIRAMQKGKTNGDKK